MTKKGTKSINELQSENIDAVLREGPRLRYGQNHWVVARDRKANMCLIGGLGCMGVGEMWVPDSDEWKSLPNYEDVPEFPCREVEK